MGRKDCSLPAAALWTSSGLMLKFIASFPKAIAFLIWRAGLTGLWCGELHDNTEGRTHQLSERDTHGSEDGGSAALLLHSACLQPKQQLPGSWPVGLVESKSDNTHGVAKLKSLAQHWCVTGAVPRSSWPPDLLSNKWKLVLTIPTIRNRKEGKISSWQDRLFRLEEMSCLVFQKGENSQQRKQREQGHWIRQLFFCTSGPLSPSHWWHKLQPLHQEHCLLEGPWWPGC